MVACAACKQRAAFSLQPAAFCRFATCNVPAAQARCPLVDEDLDLDCIDACAADQLRRGGECLEGCTASCGEQAAVVRAHCEGECELPETALPGGGTLGECMLLAKARPAARLSDSS